ncbi:DEAD/DEAH box helicase, partial [Arthrospira platensis SPKY2]
MRAAYLCPLRALAREIGGQWHAALLPYRTGVFTGERGLDEEGLLAGSPREADVGIFTAEKFDGYLRAWLTNLDWLAEVDLVVVDELHLLGDDSRGATLEGVLSRF